VSIALCLSFVLNLVVVTCNVNKHLNCVAKFVFEADREKEATQHSGGSCWRSREAPTVYSFICRIVRRTGAQLMQVMVI
jgi:hypothetical protein